MGKHTHTHIHDVLNRWMEWDCLFSDTFIFPGQTCPTLVTLVILVHEGKIGMVIPEPKSRVDKIQKRLAGTL